MTQIHNTDMQPTKKRPGRPGISFQAFSSVWRELIAAGIPTKNITLDMLAKNLEASSGTLVKMRNKYLAENPETNGVARNLSLDIVSSIESYGDRRETAAREELSDKILRSSEIEQALLLENSKRGEKIEELEADSELLKTRNATLVGENGQQAKELGALKEEMQTIKETAAAHDRAAQTSKGDAQAALGRVEEVRASTERQLDKLNADLEAARNANAGAEQRVSAAELRAVDAEAHLAGERNASAALASQLEILQLSVRQMKDDAARAAAAEASNAGLLHQISMLNDTIKLLRELLANASKSNAQVVPSAPAAAVRETGIDLVLAD